MDEAAAVLAGDRRVIVLDVEATCWKGVWSRQKETIEIGAVRYQKGLPPEEWPEFQTFVKPLRHPKLSNFCIGLTAITQADVDGAPLFPRAMHDFLTWTESPKDVVLASWSGYDLWQLELDLELHRLPKLSLPHLDVKKLATRLLGGKSFEKTAAELGCPFEGGRHRAIHDAVKTAQILDRLLNLQRRGGRSKN